MGDRGLRHYRAAEGFIAYGLVLALVWVRDGSVDVALTAAALGSGLTGLLLLRAAARLPPTDPAETARPGRGVRILAALLSAIPAGGLAAVVYRSVVPWWNGANTKRKVSRR